MEYMIFAAALFLFFVLYLIRGVIDARRRRAAFIQKLYSDYGCRSSKKYPDGRLAAIAGNFAERGAESMLDDITWNDLSMDEIFAQADFTFSAAGEEALYRMLRCPCDEEETLLEREKMISYFMSHEDDRVRLQVFFARMGRTGKYSIYDYISYLDALEDRSSGKHFVVLGLILAALLLCFIRLEFGLPALIVLLTYNMITYFREKDEIDPYITTFAYFLRVLSTAEELAGYQIEVIEPQKKALLERAALFDKFSRFSFLVTQKSAAAGGDPMEVVLDYLRMMLHLNLIKFNTMLREARLHQEDIIFIMETLGDIEAMISVGCYRASLPYYVVPKFFAANEEGYTGKDVETSEEAGNTGKGDEGGTEAEHAGKRIEDGGDEKHAGEAAEEKKNAGQKTGGGWSRLRAADIYHPLLNEPVANSVCLQRGMLLTGSNASGKSTFLKTIAVSQILAQTFHMVCAREYETGFYRVYTSMALRDDLMSGDSYFIVEIKAMKRILDAAAERKGRVMCFVDEVLRGTNTVERIAASTEILSGLVRSGAFSFAATHDIELTELLEGCYENYHFEETIEDGDIRFNYRLIDGKATTKNAIRLLGMLGFEEHIIRQAELRADQFTESGEWKR